MSVSELPNPIDLAAEPDFQLGNLQVSPSTREVVGEREREILEPRVMQVLVTLARRRGQVVSRDHLIKECWGGRVVGEDAINRCIAKVRRLSEIHSGFAIETITRVGYRVSEDVALASAPIPQAEASPAPQSLADLPQQSPAANDDIGKSRVNSRFNSKSLGIAAAVLIGVVGIVWAISLARDEHPAAPTPAASAAVTLAVLPFVNMSSDPEQEYFSDGLSEELLNQLAQIKDLRVAGRTSSFSFKGKNDDLRVIGAKLGVGNILEGSVRKAGKQLRITAQLVNTRDGTHLWSQTYSRELNDVFAIQKEIAIAVSHALSITLDVGAMSRANGGTTNVEAYDKYLRARALWLGLTHMQQAIELFREAVAIDPQYARAWYALWDALQWVPATDATSREIAEAAARHLALAPDAWRSNGIRANQFVASREWSRAEAAARAGVAEEPSSEFEAGTMLSYVLQCVGRRKEAVRYFERAQQLEPLSLGISGVLQGLYTTSDRLADAAEEYRRGKSLAGNRAFSEISALLSLWQNTNSSPAAVAAQFRVLLNLDTPPNPLNHALLPILNDRVAALAVIRKAFDDPTSQSNSRMDLIILYADHFGDKDLALAALRRLIVDMGGRPGTLWTRWETELRADPRFKDIVRELKLPDYWRASGNYGDFCKPVGTDDFECR